MKHPHKRRRFRPAGNRDPLTLIRDAVSTLMAESISNRPGSGFTDPGHNCNEHPAHSIASLYRFISEVSRECFWVWEIDQRRFLWIDGGHRRLFGYELENCYVTEEYWMEHIHPDDRLRIREEISASVAGGKSSWEQQYRFQKNDNSYLAVRDRAHVLYNSGHKPVWIIGVTQDNSAEQTLAERLASDAIMKQVSVADSILTSLENERTEIGVTLNENLNQLLAVAKLYLQLAITSGENRELNLNRTLDLIGEVITEIRKMAKSLVLPDIQVIGLAGNVRNLVFDLSELYPVKFTVDIDESWSDGLSPKLQLTIFRVIQDQLKNCVANADISVVRISVGDMGGNVVVMLSDNRIPDHTPSRADELLHMNIAARVAVCRGQLAVGIDSEGFTSLRLDFANPGVKPDAGLHSP